MNDIKCGPSTAAGFKGPDDYFSSGFIRPLNRISDRRMTIHIDIGSADRQDSFSVERKQIDGGFSNCRSRNTAGILRGTEQILWLSLGQVANQAIEVAQVIVNVFVLL
jgi:hypothetical protein